MFNQTNTRSLTLQIADASYEFASPEDFAFALAGRAGLPGTRIVSLIEMNTVSLRREGKAIRRVEQTFDDALNGLLQDVTRIGPFLKGIDLSLISHDHDWRAIIIALNSMSEPQEGFKKVALVKYVQYLAARRQAITAIYSDRRDASQSDSEVYDDGKMRETAIFNVSELANLDAEIFVRLPKGETVEVDLEGEDKVSMLLAKHRCRLTMTAGKLVFIDDAEQATPLRPGRLIVGRDASCDVRINSTYNEISRKHLILEVGSTSKVCVIDISSHGTSLHPRFLENTRI